jgi:hypothetical protein
LTYDFGQVVPEEVWLLVDIAIHHDMVEGFQVCCVQVVHLSFEENVNFLSDLTDKKMECGEVRVLTHPKETRNAHRRAIFLDPLLMNRIALLQAVKFVHNAIRAMMHLSSTSPFKDRRTGSQISFSFPIKKLGRGGPGRCLNGEQIRW